VARRPDAGVVGQHALQPLAHLGRAVGDDHLPGVQRVADAHAAAVVERDPARAAGDVQQRVQDRPVGDGVAAVLHRLGLAEGRGHRAGVQVVAADHDGRLQLAGGHQVVQRHAEARALALPEPADARRQPLEGDLLRAISIQRRRCSSSGKSSSTSSSVRWMSAGSPESATQRKGPLPSQKSGRTYAGTKPGKANASA
jgi:hypothetical protein